MNDRRDPGTSELAEEVRYSINSDDLLIEFNTGWDSFAKANDSPHLLGERIIRRSLWDFISGPETAQVHQALLRKVRAGKSPLRLPFRCDSPALRRHMELNMAQRDNGVIEYRCRLLKTEERTPAPPLPVSRKPSLTPCTRMCSWCNRVDAGGTWLEIEEAVAKMGLLDDDLQAPFTHTMCNDCLELTLDDEPDPE